MPLNLIFDRNANIVPSYEKDVINIFDGLIDTKEHRVYYRDNVMKLEGRFMEIFPYHFDKRCTIIDAKKDSDMQGDMSYDVHLLHGKVSIKASLISSKFDLSNWGDSDHFKDSDGRSSAEIKQNLEGLSGMYIEGKYILGINSIPLTLGREKIGDCLNAPDYDASAINILLQYFLQGKSISLDSNSYKYIDFENRDYTINVTLKDLSLDALTLADKYLSQYAFWFADNKPQIHDAMAAINEAYIHYNLSKQQFRVERGYFTQVTLDRFCESKNQWVERMNQTLKTIGRPDISEISKYIYTRNDGNS